MTGGLASAGESQAHGGHAHCCPLSASAVLTASGSRSVSALRNPSSAGLHDRLWWVLTPLSCTETSRGWDSETGSRGPTALRLVPSWRRRGR